MGIGNEVQAFRKGTPSADVDLQYPMGYSEGQFLRLGCGDLDLFVKDVLLLQHHTIVQILYYIIS